MNKYNAYFTGREVGSIGIVYPISVFNIEAENQYKAKEKLYEKYEHVSDCDIFIVNEKLEA